MRSVYACPSPWGNQHRASLLVRAHKSDTRWGRPTGSQPDILVLVPEVLADNLPTTPCTESPHGLTKRIASSVRSTLRGGRRVWSGDHALDIAVRRQLCCWSCRPHAELPDRTPRHLRPMHRPRSTPASCRARCASTTITPAMPPKTALRSSGSSRMAFGPAPESHLLDTLDRGLYCYEVRDASSKQLLFSRGFCSVFGEWQTTTPAREQWGTFHESLRFPWPKSPVTVTLKKRRQRPVDRTCGRRTIDPQSRFVNSADLPPRGNVWTVFENGTPPRNWMSSCWAMATPRMTSQNSTRMWPA